jgi:hypothetical protein
MSYDTRYDSLSPEIRNAIVTLVKRRQTYEIATRALAGAVIYARRKGASWEWIGNSLGCSRQSAWETYRTLVQEETPDGREETSDT